MCPSTDPVERYPRGLPRPVLADRYVMRPTDPLRVSGFPRRKGFLISSVAENLASVTSFNLVVP